MNDYHVPKELAHLYALDIDVLHWAFLLITLFIIINAFLTLARTSLISTRQSRLARLGLNNNNQESFNTVHQLLQEPVKVFATIQVGMILASFTAAGISVGVLSPVISYEIYRHIFVNYHYHPSTSFILILGAAITILLISFMNIVIGDLIPYSYAQKYPEKTASAVAVPVKIFIGLVGGLTHIALSVSNMLVKPLGLTASFASPLITEEELQTLIEASAQSGAIEEGEKDIIRNVISFGDIDARQVMTPRIDMTAADANINVHDLVNLIIKSGHSRIPLYEGSVDTIVGIVYIKDLLTIMAKNDLSLSVRQIARPAIFVPENRSVDDLLQEFRLRKSPIAIVQDEFGGTAGLVTMEDLLEEIVGDIGDEYDKDADKPLIHVINEKEYLVDGRMSILDVNEELSIEIPDEDYDTIGGFAFGLFGHQPEINESTLYTDILFTVTKTDGRRIQELRLDLGVSNDETTNENQQYLHLQNE